MKKLPILVAAALMALLAVPFEAASARGGGGRGASTSGIGGTGRGRNAGRKDKDKQRDKERAARENRDSLRRDAARDAV